MDKIDWFNLSRNSNAIHLLEENKDKICWEYFSSNKSIFEEVINKEIYENIQKTLEIILIK
jgi:hypothetical protein